MTTLVFIITVPYFVNQQFANNEKKNTNYKLKLKTKSIKMFSSIIKLYV